MKKKTFDRAFNWFLNKVKLEEKIVQLMFYQKDVLLNNFKQDFKKRSIVETKGINVSIFSSWSFENDEWKVVKQHEATKLVFRIHFKNTCGRKRLIKRYFVKINWNEHL